MLVFVILWLVFFTRLRIKKIFCYGLFTNPSFLTGKHTGKGDRPACNITLVSAAMLCDTLNKNSNISMTCVL